MLVRDLMTKDPITVLSKETLAQARAKMFARKIRRLPVVSGKDLVGIISENPTSAAATRRLVRLSWKK